MAIYEEQGILPAVKFYQKEYKNNFKSEQEGRDIYEMKDFVRIEIPGNQLSIIDTIANDDHKQKFPIQWARYQNEKTDDQIEGTLLRDWSAVNPAQARELAHMHFYTVEQVANASDDQISKVTMVVGMSGHSFREKAQRYLKVSKDSAVVESMNEDSRRKDEEIAALKEQMAQLMANQQPKRGRPAQGAANE